MSIKEFMTGEELDEEFDRIEQINMDYVDLKANVEECVTALDIAEVDLRDAKDYLEEAEKDLADFITEHNEELLL